MTSICDMVVNSVCAFQGQVIAGGFINPWQGAGTDCVGWSRIGSAEFAMEKDNTAGWMKMPGNGTCHKVLSLRKGVMAYGTNSICAIYPVTEPAQTYGKYDIFSNLGIADRDAADGDGDGHHFLAADGRLFYISNDFKPKDLGYRHLFGSLVGSSSNVILSWDSFNQELYIGFDSASYVYSQFGMSEIYESLTRINPIEGTLYASYADVSGASPPTWLAETDILDFGLAGRKTIMSLELEGSLAGTTYGKVLWRNDKTASFSDPGWIRFSPGGVCHQRVSGREVKIQLKGTSAADVELTFMNTKFLMDDNRNIRGQLS